MNNELWKVNTEFPDYKVSSSGHVRRKSNGINTFPGRLIKPRPGKDGYFIIAIQKNKRSFTLTLHRLVLETFLGPRPSSHECNHKDGKKENNCLDNLEWVTSSKNKFHAFSTELRSGDLVRGENSGVTKLKEGEVYLIKHLLKSKQISQKMISKMFLMSQQGISRIKLEEVWSHVTYP